MIIGVTRQIKVRSRAGIKIPASTHTHKPKKTPKSLSERLRKTITKNIINNKCNVIINNKVNKKNTE